MIQYRIWARVSGGITGFHEGWLRVADVPVEFATRAEAEREAGRLMEMTNGNPHRKAVFSYTVQTIQS